MKLHCTCLPAGCETRENSSGGNVCLPVEAGEVFAVSKADKDEIKECFNAFAKGKSSFEPNSRCSQLVLQDWASIGCDCADDVETILILSTKHCGTAEVCGSVSSFSCPGTSFREIHWWCCPFSRSIFISTKSRNLLTDFQAQMNTDRLRMLRYKTLYGYLLTNNNSIATVMISNLPCG